MSTASARTGQRTVPILLGVLVALFMAVPGSATELVLDPGQTQIAFLLGSTFHDVHGILRLQEGTIEFDAAEGTASGRIVIDALSASTHHKARDKKMHSKVLETQRYPLFVFEPVSMTGELQPATESHVQLSGILEMHGSRHELTLDADVRLDGAELSGRFELVIPYVEWGMNDPSVFVVRAKKEVVVEIRVKGRVIN